MLRKCKMVAISFGNIEEVVFFFKGFLDKGIKAEREGYHSKTKSIRKRKYELQTFIIVLVLIVILSLLVCTRKYELQTFIIELILIVISQSLSLYRWFVLSWSGIWLRVYGFYLGIGVPSQKNRHLCWVVSFSGDCWLFSYYFLGMLGACFTTNLFSSKENLNMNVSLAVVGLAVI